MTLSSEILADVTSVIFDTEDFALSASVSRSAETITPTVIIAMQEVKSKDRTGFEISRNWVVLQFPVTEYDFSSGSDEPSIMDRYTISSRKYEPRTPEGKKDCWEYTDGTSQIYKVFVEEVSA